MTKKIVGLLVMALFLTVAASASTFAEGCGSLGASAPPQPGPPFPPFTPGLTGNTTCAAFMVPAGQTLTDVLLSFKNDWQLGAAGTDTLGFNYTITGFNISSMISTVTGTGAGGSDVPVSTNQGTCSVSGDTVTCDRPISLAGPATYNAMTIGISAAWTTGGLDFSGSEGTTINALFTFGPAASTPEPASLLMISSGLIGLALAIRRSRKA